MPWLDECNQRLKSELLASGSGRRIDVVAEKMIGLRPRFRKGSLMLS